MSDQHFLDLIGATNLIPGPNSTEMAIHIGYDKAGWKGLILAGLCFILPAVLITGIFAWAYKEYGQLPDLQAFIYGIKPVIIPIILSAILPLAKTSLKNAQLAFIGLVSLALALFQINGAAIMFGAGIVALLLLRIKEQKNLNMILPLVFEFRHGLLLKVSNLKLFLTFLKIGSILYGSGYVLFAFLDNELVSKGILSRSQLIDAIAIGQVTPGPVFSSVTFIGYQINGISGAVVSTIGIFLPSFIFVALLNPFIKKMRESNSFSVFLDAVNVASIAVILAVCFYMGKDAITDWKSASISIMGFVLVFMFRKINSAWVILTGAISGYLLTLI